MKHLKSLASAALASTVKDRCKDDVPQRQSARVAQVPCAAEVAERSAAGRPTEGTLSLEAAAVKFHWVAGTVLIFSGSPSGQSGGVRSWHSIQLHILRSSGPWLRLLPS